MVILEALARMWEGGGQALGSVTWLPGRICLAADGGTNKKSCS